MCAAELMAPVGVTSGRVLPTLSGFFNVSVAAQSPLFPSAAHWTGVPLTPMTDVNITYIAALVSRCLTPNRFG